MQLHFHTYLGTKVDMKRTGSSNKDILYDSVFIIQCIVKASGVDVSHKLALNVDRLNNN